METYSKRRISDVSFVIDRALTVTDGNRSFKRLFSVTDPRIKLSDYMDKADVRNFSHFLEHFPGSAEEAAKNPYFIVNITPDGEDRARPLNCLLHVARRGDGLFDVNVKELSYSKTLLDRALLESREYRSLLQNFDAYYFVFDGTKFTLKNTKDSNVLFEGSAGAFEDYFSANFRMNLGHGDSRAQLSLMIADSLKLTADRTYRMLQTDAQLVTVHTVRTATRSSSLIIGSIATDGAGARPSQNAYGEDKDGLTGLYSKKAITEMATKKVNEAKNPVSLIVLDIDKFKDCNDTFGHAFGDKVLVTVAESIRDAVEGLGTAGRIGGDEFLVVLDRTEEEDIRAVARKIRSGVRWGISATAPSNVVTCSMGIARHPLDADDYDELFRIADKCLYIAKGKGRNCYVIYRPDMHEAAVNGNEPCADGADSDGECMAKSAEREAEILSLISGGNAAAAAERLADYLQVCAVSAYDLRAEGGARRPVHAERVQGGGTDFRRERLDGGGYFKFFNAGGFLHMDNTGVLNSLDQSAFAMYGENDVASTLEVRIDGADGNPAALVCFDQYRTGRTFPKDKLVFALLSARLLAGTFGR